MKTINKFRLGGMAFLCMFTALFMFVGCLSENDETIALKENPRHSAYTSYINEKGQTVFVYNTPEGADAYIITNKDGKIEKMNLVFGKGDHTDYGTVFFYNNKIRSITFQNVTYTFHENNKGKVDVAITAFGHTELFTDVDDALSIAYADGTDVSQVFACIVRVLEVIKNANSRISNDSSIYSYVSSIVDLLSKVDDSANGLTDSDVCETLVDNAEYDEDPEDFDLSGVGNNEYDAENNTDIGNGAIASGIGALKVTLTWKFSADIDLHVYEPGCTTSIPASNAGKGHIYYSSRRDSFTDGYLDIDNTVGYYINPLTGERNERLSAVENVYWNENPKNGVFYVYLHYFAGSQSGPCTVTVYKNGKTLLTKTVNMSSANHSSQNFIASINMPLGTISQTRATEDNEGVFDFWNLPVKK